MSRELLMMIFGLVLLLATLGWVIILSFTPSSLGASAIPIVLLLSLSFFLVCMGFTELER